MKNFFYIMMAAMLFFSGNVFAEDDIKNDKIYFFTYDGCPYCQMANEHIQKMNVALNIEKIDIYKPGGMYLFKKCAEKFNLGRNIGTPLFCMGDNYLMGWSDENQKRFDELSLSFKK